MNRPAKPSDISAVTKLGIEALKEDPFENLLIDTDKVFNMARECISSAKNFSYVCEHNGEIVGAVLALVHELMFYERNQATVVMFYSKAPGEGIKLIREFLDWARKRPGIKMIVFTLERKADPRIGKLLKRLGLKTDLPVYIELR